MNGHKLWTSSAQLADWIYLAVRTSQELPKHKGISVFVCPMSTPGIEVRTFGTLGGGVLCEVFLDDVVIPERYLVGELDRGWEVLMYTLDFERVTAEKIGGFAWVLDALEARLRDTHRLDATARAELRRLRGQVQAARLLSFRAADALDRGVAASALSAMAKLAGGSARAGGRRQRGRPARARRVWRTARRRPRSRGAPPRSTVPARARRSPAARRTCRSS